MDQLKDAGLMVMTKINTSDKKEQLTLLLLAAAVLTFSFSICALVVAGTANVGFNVVFTALLNIGWVGGSYFVIKNSKTPLAIGFLIGVSCMICIISFMTSIYWGQLSKCSKIALAISQYTCSNPTAYGAVCFFSVFLFLDQLAFSIAVILWKGELINEQGGIYDDLSTSSAHGLGGAASAHGVPYDLSKIGSNSFSQPPPSTDL